MLAGPVTDQAALHGLLAKVGDLGLPLLSVRRVDPEQDSPAEPPHDVDAGEGGRTRMYATITKLQVKAEEQAVEAVEGLSVLLDEAGGLPGLLQGRVVRSGPRELVMVTVYESEARRRGGRRADAPQAGRDDRARRHRRTRPMGRTGGRRVAMTDLHGANLDREEGR